jgi:hypothetical protein
MTLAEVKSFRQLYPQLKILNHNIILFY